MFNEKDILELLQKGETADTIAKQFSEVLNKAEATRKKEIKEQEDAKRLEKEKEEALNKILDSIYNFIYEFYCDNAEDVKTLNDAFDNLSAKKVLDMLESVSVEFGKLNDMMNSIDLVFKPAVPAKKGDKTSTKAVDTLINDFLKSMDW